MSNLILEEKLEEMRKTYQAFGLATQELETYLMAELEHTYIDSGEEKDLLDAVDKLEELFKFVITAKESRLEKLS